MLSPPGSLRCSWRLLASSPGVLLCCLAADTIMSGTSAVLLVVPLLFLYMSSQLVKLYYQTTYSNNIIIFLSNGKNLWLENNKSLKWSISSWYAPSHGTGRNFLTSFSLRMRDKTLTLLSSKSKQWSKLQRLTKPNLSANQARCYLLEPTTAKHHQH